MRSKPVKTWIIVTGMVVWMVGVISAYFVIHKPWDLGQNLAPLWALVDVMFVLSLTGLAGGLGRRLTGSCIGMEPPIRLALQAGIGLGILGISVLFIGLIGVLQAWILWLMIVIGLIVNRRDVSAWLREWRFLRQECQELGGFGSMSFWYVWILIVLNLFQALAPPLRWDALVYHLEIPSLYLQEGRISFISGNLFFGFPQLAEMLYTWGMVLLSGESAAALGWMAGVLAIVGLAGFSRRFVSHRLTWLAPAVLLSGYSISQALSWSYVDLWVMLYGLLVFVSLHNFAQIGKRKWLVISGVLAGFAQGVKYSAGILLPLGILFLLIEQLNQRIQETRASDEDKIKYFTDFLKNLASWASIRKIILEVMIFCGVTLIVSAPWLIKNLILTGNPIYPFIFPGREMDILRQSFHRGDLYPRTLMNDLLLPLQVTLYGVEGGSVEGQPYYDTSIGPLLLALAPGLLIGWKKIKKKQLSNLNGMVAIAVATWILWAIFAHFADQLSRSRHYYSIFPVFAILAAAGFSAVSHLRLSQVRLRRVVTALVCLSFGLSLYTNLLAFIKINPFPVIFGVESESDFIERNLGWYGSAIQAVNRLSEESVVVFLWEPRSYYCRITCLPDVILDRWWYLRRTRVSPTEIASYMKSQGITHVLIYDLGVNLERKGNILINFSDWKALDSFKSTELQMVEKFGDAYSLYSLKSYTP